MIFGLREALMLLGAAGLLVAGGALLLDARSSTPKRALVVPGVGRASAVSHAVIGLACLGAAYHLVVHALGLAQFRAPLPVAVGVALVAIVGTLMVDKFEGAGGDEAPEDEL